MGGVLCIPCRSLQKSSKYIVDDRYVVLEKIGEGGYGEIFKVEDLHSHTIHAMKIEKSTDGITNQLEAEIKFLTDIKGDEPVGIPDLLDHGFCKKYNFNYLIMPLFGNNLDHVFKEYERKFSLKTVMELACTMLILIKSIHEKGYVHRDVKPSNFLVTNDPEHPLYIIDFGLIKKYIEDNGAHSNDAGNHHSIIGTARFASINNHYGHEQSRRDDLESLGYVLIYLATGGLPWMQITARTKYEKYNRIRERKSESTIAHWTKDLPPCFIKYVNYCRELKYEDDPDYKFLEDLFLEELQKTSLLDNNHKLEWMDQSRERHASFLIKHTHTDSN